jgi:hypothetical protein
MTTPLPPEERVTTLEYAVFHQFPATMAAMTHGTNLVYAETVANGEAIAGLRVDFAALQVSLHRDVCNLKAALDLQGDSLRKELGVATAGFRADVTGVREMMDLRFQKVDGQSKAVHAEMNHRFTAVDQRFDGVDQRFDGVDQRFDGVDQRFDGLDAQLRGLRADLDAKLDTILSELRRPAG